MNSTSDDYIQKLKDALNVTRQEMIAQIDAAQGDYYVALQSKQVAATDEWVGQLALERTQHGRLICEAIGELATEARLTAGVLAQYVEAATAAAAATADTMATAAASIKDADAALETLTKSAYGITALAHGNDKGTEVDASAKVVKKALKAALLAVNDLKQASLDGSIQAAQALSGGVGETFALVKTQIEAIDAQAVAALARANDLAQKALDDYHAANGFHYQQTTPVGMAAVKRDTGRAALDELDRRTEGEIQPVCTNDPGLTVSTFTSRPGLPEPKFIAVERQAAVTFKLKAFPTANVYDAKGPIVTDYVTEKKLQWGKSYCVFAVRQVAAPEGGSPVMLSLPSAPVLVRWSSPAPPSPSVLRLEADAFLLAIPPLAPPPGPDQDSPKGPELKEYRVFLVPSSLCSQNPLDEQYLSESATPASYLSLVPSQALPVTDKEAKKESGNAQLSKELVEWNLKDAAFANLPSAVPGSDQGARTDEAKRIESWIPSGAVLAYFSPYTPPTDPLAPKDTSAQVTVGSYTDAFGNPIDLSQEDYRAAYVAVYADSESSADAPLEAAIMALSDSVTILQSPQPPSPVTGDRKD